MTDAASASTAPEAAAPRVGVAGWAQGLAARAGEPDIRHAAAITVAIAIAVFALGRVPVGDAIDLDLRDGDAVGGWSQVTLVGFSVNRPFGRFVPDQPGRSDLRIVSNRPLPAPFELELTAWTLRPGRPVSLELRVGDVTRVHRFDAERSTASLAFANAAGARSIELALGEGDKLAVERIRIRSIEAGAP